MVKWKRVEDMRWLWDATVVRTAGSGVLLTGRVHMMWEGWFKGV